MEVLLRTAAAVGIAASSDRPGAFAALVKVTFDLGALGRGAVSREQRPLSEGEVSARGIVLYPSNFAFARSSCEVVAVGEALEQLVGPAYLRVGPCERNVASVTELSALHAEGVGQPFAPAAQRMTLPSFPLSIQMACGGRSFGAVVTGPRPDVVVVRKSDWESPLSLDVELQEILVDPGREQCALVFRAYFEHVGDADAELLLVVDPSAGFDGTPLGEVRRWPCVRAATAHADDESTGDLEETQDVVLPRFPLSAEHPTPVVTRKKSATVMMPVVHRPLAGQTIRMNAPGFLGPQREQPPASAATPKVTPVARRPAATVVLSAPEIMHAAMRSRSETLPTIPAAARGALPFSDRPPPPPPAHAAPSIEETVDLTPAELEALSNERSRDGHS